MQRIPQWTSFYLGHAITIRGNKYLPTGACVPNYLTEKFSLWICITGNESFDFCFVNNQQELRKRKGNPIFFKRNSQTLRINNSIRFISIQISFFGVSVITYVYICICIYTWIVLSLQNKQINKQINKQTGLPFLDLGFSRNK